jgi:hypothetical protein
MTFETLQQDVRRYLERGATMASDAVVYEQIPRLINLAERRIARELKVQGFIVAVTDNLVPGQSVYAKPDRWRETVSINIGTGAANANRTFLFTRAYEYLRSYWPNESLTAEPLFYSDYNYSHWLIAPTPDQAYPIEILYYERIAPLSSSNQTNWLTRNAPNAMLYGTLLQAMPFLKNDQRVIFQQKYTEAMRSLKDEDISRIPDRQAIVTDS